MAKTIAKIEIAIEKKGAPAESLTAELSLEGKTSYTLFISQPDGKKEKTTIESGTQEPANVWLLQKLKTMVDQFDPNTATVKVISDPQNLLPKVTYRCQNPHCRAKLFESWGVAPGIRIVCRKCKTLGIPQRQEAGNA